MKYAGNNAWALAHPDYLEHFGDWMRRKEKERGDRAKLQRRIKKERLNHVRNQSDKSK